ncbi:MAG: hypothetical protein AB4206_13825 [Xenococcaceae cyanobacterium]
MQLFHQGLKYLLNSNQYLTDKKLEFLSIETPHYYRTSGVISDAASCSCYIVASDYPLIKNQIAYPVEIGTTFNDFTELDRSLDKAIDYVISNGQDNHWLWREKRTAKHIASLLFP